MKLTLVVYCILLAGLVWARFSPSDPDSRGVAIDQPGRSVSAHLPQREISPLFKLTSPEIAFDELSTADDKLWNDKQCKGDQFVTAMPATDAEAARIFQVSSGTMRSPWQGDFKDGLLKWSWEENLSDQGDCDFIEVWKYTTAMKALNLNGRPKAKGGDNECFSVMHEGKREVLPVKEQMYKVDGKEYRQTGSYFDIGINHRGGVIFGQWIFGAVEKAKKNWDVPNPDPSELPALRSFSDFMYGFWHRDNPDVQNLRYYWVQGLANVQAVKIVARALGNRKVELDNWPGTTALTTYRSKYGRKYGRAVHGV